MTDRRPAGAWRGAAPAVTMAAWGGNHYSPLLLMYRAVEGYTAVQVNLFFAFYILGLIPGFLVAGPLSDEHGRKRIVTGAVLLGILGSIILAVGGSHSTLMCLGRFVSGVSVATAMVVGTSWIKELSQDDAVPGTRARRASLTLTAGFGLGAGVSGALAQWAPAPTVLPYAVQIALSLGALIPLRWTPETRAGHPSPLRSLLTDLEIPAAGRARFYRAVLPVAPWVFSAAALSFVVGPALVAPQVGSYRVAFAALVAVVTLACGAAVQPFVPAIARRTKGRQSVVGVVLAAVATAVLAVDARLGSPASVVLSLVLVAAVLFGIAYGICLVAGLVEVQAMAEPHSLAGLTGIYYSLTYLGFTLPVLLAELARHLDYTSLLVGVAVIAVGCAAVVGSGRPPAPQR